MLCTVRSIIDKSQTISGKMKKPMHWVSRSRRIDRAFFLIPSCTFVELATKKRCDAMFHFLLRPIKYLFWYIFSFCSFPGECFGFVDSFDTFPLTTVRSKSEQTSREGTCVSTVNGETLSRGNSTRLLCWHYSHDRCKRQRVPLTDFRVGGN